MCLYIFLLNNMMLISQLQLILTMLDETMKTYFKHDTIKQYN